MVWRGLLLVSSACGRLSFEPRGGAIDGGADVLATVDSEVDAALGMMVVTFGETGSAGVAGVTFDTVLDAVNSVGNYGNRPTLDLDGQWTPLLRFDLSSIPSSATVIDARLTLYTADQSTTDTITVLRVTQSWTEGATNGAAGEANFLERHTATLWEGPGATGPSRAGTVGSFMPIAVGSAYTFAIALATVQMWVGSPQENFGLVFDSDGTDTVRFHSSESFTSSSRPVLRITYAP